LVLLHKYIMMHSPTNVKRRDVREWCVDDDLEESISAIVSWSVLLSGSGVSA